MLSTQLAKFLRKWWAGETRLHLIVVWFHWKLRAKKRGELLWAITSKKNFSNLHSAAFFYNLAIPRSIVYKYTLQVLRTLETEKAFK